MNDNEQILEAVVEICRYRNHYLRFREISEKGIEPGYAPGFGRDDLVFQHDGNKAISEGYFKPGPLDSYLVPLLR